MIRHAEELPRLNEAPALGRRAVAEWFANVLEPAEVDNAKLVVSELVTNAVRHGEGRIQLRAELDDDRLLIEVVDEGKGFVYEAQVVPFDQLSGRGLSIVDTLASRWGIHAGSNHVWAELERPGPRVGERPDYAS